MYDDIISKMTTHFSEIGSILYSKAYDFFKKDPISTEEIETYYDLLCSDEIISQNINRRNHQMCCLFYLSKDDNNYIDIFVEKYIGSIELNSLEINSENLIMVFNIIEFDKIYLKSNYSSFEFLYTMQKKFANFETDYQNYIIYKYYRGYLKFKLGDKTQANKEYLELLSEIQESDNIMMKYIKILNSLLKVQMNSVNLDRTRAEIYENIQFLEDLFTNMSSLNKVISLKLGFELFSAYIEYKEYNKCIKHLLMMKKILKKDILRGSSLKNGIDYYLAIASRIGYIGVLLNDKVLIEKAIKKIKKALELIGKNTDDKKINDLFQAYKFVISILEICLNQKTENDILHLSKEFKRILLPDLKSNAYHNDIVNKDNKESIIINFKIIDNEYQNDIHNCSKSILEKSYKELKERKNVDTTNFIIFLSAYHDKIYRYSERYIAPKKENGNKNTNANNDYAAKIKKKFLIVEDIIEKYIDDPFLQTEYAKILIIEIYSAYANILFEEKDDNNLQKIIKNIMDDQKSNLRRKLKIDKNISAYGLWLKIKGDYYLRKKHYDAACASYKEALETLEKNHPKIPLKIPLILFNYGCAFYFMKHTKKAIEYLQKSINSFLSQNRGTNYFGHYPDKDTIETKIKTAQNLVNALTKLDNNN